MTAYHSFFLTLLILLSAATSVATDKPKLTLDEFFNSVQIDSVSPSPDGHAIVIATERADWDRNIFRKDLWLYRDNAPQSALALFTQSGYDSAPKWSPDGKWVAFSSERKTQVAGSTSDHSDEEKTTQLYLIAADAGEAFPVTEGDEDVHAFAWSPDSRQLYFATRKPWTEAQKDAHKQEWHDVQRYREDERGDEIFSLEVSTVVSRHEGKGAEPYADNNAAVVSQGAKILASLHLRVQEMAVSPTGESLAFVSESVSQRDEKANEFEIYTLSLSQTNAPSQPQQVTHNEALEQNIQWAKDGKHLFFQVEYGSVEGKYRDTQERLYWVDVDTGKVDRWGEAFDGTVIHYTVEPNGGIIAAARSGTEVQIYSQASLSAPFSKRSGWPGTYESITACDRSSRVTFVHSTLEKPTEVYVAESIEKLSTAQALTSFNKTFTERDLPKGKPYRWVADDGTPVEGMLMYPPGKFEAKNLPLFVFIHGGPDDADGNHFQADWYVWDRLAATAGWLVFEPNYRGSAGYGDKFLMGIVPHMVSRPGKDILEGVDALVKDGTADSNHLTIGGYSFGGYLTNWLITQTTRFKAAVTGAGAVENVAEWGNDDFTIDDSYFLNGPPWVAPHQYEAEGAIFQANNIKTPTHIVTGSEDIRVAPLQAYLLEHALNALDVPNTLLIFPGEGHDLGKNPWNGKIKVREELKWLAKYGGAGDAEQQKH